MSKLSDSREDDNFCLEKKSAWFAALTFHLNGL